MPASQIGTDTPRPVVALVQARMGSSRLPGKVLRQVAGRSLLAHLIERLRAARTLDALVVATTTDPGDDVLVQEATRLGVGVFRGSEADVLGRFAGAAAQAQARTLVRVTADCPLMDPAEVDRVVGAFLSAWPDLDYVTNQLPGQRKVPLGLAVEVFSRQALERAHQEAQAPYQREHVTPYLYDTPGRFRIRCQDPPLDHSALRITVDTPDDLAVVAPTLEALEGLPDAFTLQAAVDFLSQHPEIAARNASIVQKSHLEAAGTVALLRADATAQGGAGHVMRLLGLGEAWTRRGGRAVLLSHQLTPALADRYLARGMQVLALPPQVQPGSQADLDATRQQAAALGARLVLVDGYQFPHDWLDGLRDPAWKVAYVDDFGDPELPVDATLMPNAGATPPPAHRAAVVLAGHRFTPVRSDFRDVPRPQRTFDHRPLRLLLTFGGSDPAGMSLPALRAAVDLARQVPIETTLLLGPAHPDVASVRSLAQQTPGVRVLHDVADMATLLSGTDLAVSAGGTTCWELATLGVPMLLVQVADNQAVVLGGIAQAGAGMLLPPAQGLSPEALTAGLREFLTAGPQRWQAMSQAGMRLIDGRGADRIADALAELSASGAQS